LSTKTRAARPQSIGSVAARSAFLAAGLLVLASATGCIVPQPRGDGQLQRIVEPATQRPYFLYLPKEYVAADETTRAARRWPLVVTFHGMKPYDIAHSQALEWEQEADRYGYIVIAPELLAFDFFFGEFPLRHVNSAFKSDEIAVLAIMDHVFRNTHADPSRVLSTSWSSGGYMAHYMLNRHPEQFSCLAVRQSNFSAEILDASLVSRSIYHPVLILGTQHDVPICKEESREAIKWYETHGYKNLAWIYLNRLGHERTPDAAADFFSRVCGVQPNRPPEVLVQRQAIDGNARGLALLAGNLAGMQPPPGREVVSPDAAAFVRPPTQHRPTMVAASPPTPTKLPSAKSAPEPQPVGTPTPRRDAKAAATVNPEPLDGTVGINLSSAIGFQPLLVVYSAECPVDWQRTAQFSWMLNDKLIGSAINGQKTLAEPGDYRLELLVVAPDGSEHRAARQIRVLRSTEVSTATR